MITLFGSGHMIDLPFVFGNPSSESAIDNFYDAIVIIVYEGVLTC